MRAKKQVRFHLRDSNTSIEGFLAGKTRTEYIVWAPKVLTNSATPDVELEKGHVEIPRETVLFYQVL